MRRFLRAAAALWVVILMIIGGVIVVGHARPADSVLIVGVRDTTRFNYTSLVVVDAPRCQQVTLPVLALSDALAWSPDGTQIAFLSMQRGGEELHTADWTGGHITRRTSNFSTDTHVTFSPDGQSLVFTAQSNVEVDLARYDFVEQREQVLTQGGSIEMYPSWTPDGTQIVHVASADGHFHIAALNVATGDSIRLAELPNRWVLLPQVSPDGDKIAFVSTNSSYNNDFQLHVIARDGTPIWEMPLTDQMGDYVSALRWSPDGAWIAYSQMGGDPGLIKLPAMGGEPERIACVPPNLIAFDWKRR